MIGKIFQSIEWSSAISILAFVISLASFVTSFYMAILYRKEIRLLKMQFEQDQLDREKRKFNITVWHACKYENFPKEPLKWLGVWFIISNRTEEQPLLAELDVVLHFKKRNSLAEKQGLEYWRAFLFGEKEKTALEFAMYSTFSGSTNFFSAGEVPLHFYLLDWDTKTPIYFAPQKEYLMPGPNQKKRWYFFGNIPETDSIPWMKAGYELDKISFMFITDQGKINVEKYIRYILIDKEQLAEWSSYTFDFEIAPISVFGPTYPI